MINVDNAKLNLSFESSLLGDTIANCELALFLQTRITRDWVPEINTTSLRNSLERDFKHRFQEILYGDLLDSILAAQKVSLDNAGLEGFERVKNAFEPVIDKLKVAIPVRYRESESSANSTNISFGYSGG